MVRRIGGRSDSPAALPVLVLLLTLWALPALSGEDAARVLPRGEGNRLSGILADQVTRLAGLCQCDSLRVAWRIPGGVEKAVLELQGLEAEAAPAALGPPGGPNGGAPEGCPDRITIVLRGREGTRTREYWVTGEPLCHATVALAGRSLRSGEILAETDVRWEEGWFPPSALRQGERAVAGAYLLRGVAAGRCLDRDDLRDAPLVRKGELLRVVYERGGFVLEGRAISRTDGWQGDRVNVRLEGASHDCEGVVRALGVVIVGGPEEERG